MTTVTESQMLPELAEFVRATRKQLPNQVAYTLEEIKQLLAQHFVDAKYSSDLYSHELFPGQQYFYTSMWVGNYCGLEVNVAKCFSKSSALIQVTGHDLVITYGCVDDRTYSPQGIDVPPHLREKMTELYSKIASKKGPEVKYPLPFPVKFVTIGALEYIRVGFVDEATTLEQSIRESIKLVEVTSVTINEDDRKGYN